MIIGTASLYLSGYPVSPNDLDILTDANAAKEIEQALAAYKVETEVKPNNQFRSIFSEYLVSDLKIEVMGDLEVNTPHGWVLLMDHITDPQFITFAGETFKVPGKADQLRIYTLFNREKDQVILQMLG